MTPQTFTFSPVVQISYEVQGQGPTPVVCLHGFAAARSTWHDLAPLFPADRFRLYLLDLKGFGFSVKPRDGRYGIRDQAEIVAAFLANLGLREVALVGHSLGGGIALVVEQLLRAAGTHGVLSRLVLLDCAAYPQRLPKLFRLLRFPLAGAILLRVVPARWIVRYTLPRVFANQAAITPAIIDRYTGCFSREGIPYAFITTVRQIVPPDYDRIIAGYREVPLPTLILWGRQDRIIRLHYGEQLATEIPGARLAVIETCGHNPHEERPAETWAAIAPFLIKA